MIEFSQGRNRSPLFRYLLPILSVAAAAFLHRILLRFVPGLHFPYSFLYVISAGISAWYGGYIPGLLACLIPIVILPLALRPFYPTQPINVTGLIQLVIKSLRDTLEFDGHHVVAAHGGREGIAAFKASEQSAERFSVIITDLGMPDVDGRKVASAVKNASPSTPVILLTGWGQRLAAEEGLPENVDFVLNKPPRLRDLRAALAGLSRNT
ncbi:MAG TPA: response regulator [Bryobacteraceae bacterium]|nr:response regulator [Bryobacteraceae bacterium]